MNKKDRFVEDIRREESKKTLRRGMQCGKKWTDDKQKIDCRIVPNTKLFLGILYVAVSSFLPNTFPISVLP